MRFKKPKTFHRPRSRFATDPEHEWPVDQTLYYTPVLNRAFELLMGKSQEFSTKERVHFCVLRNSWGRWSHMAVTIDGEERAPLPTGDERQLFEDLLLGSGPCPLCGVLSNSESDPRLRIYRWHRFCIARAYARDAERLGDAEQRGWAAEIFAEVGRGEE